jgi:hypothetical protein
VRCDLKPMDLCPYVGEQRGQGDGEEGAGAHALTGESAGAMLPNERRNVRTISKQKHSSDRSLRAEREQRWGGGEEGQVRL